MRVRTKFITLAAALALTATPALAQVSIGGRIGGAMATLSGDAAEDAESRIGFSIGAFVDIAASDLGSIQPELLFVQKGAEAEVDGITAGRKLSYLQIPVAAKVALPMSGSSLQPYLFAGPSLAFNIGCTDYASGSDGGQDASAEADCAEDSVESMDFSLLGGVGAAFDVGSGSASIDVRYDLGLTNVMVTENDDDPNAKNRTFSVTLGYSIPLGM